MKTIPTYPSTIALPALYKPKSDSEPVFEMYALNAKATAEARIFTNVKLKPSWTIGFPNWKVSCQEILIGSNFILLVKSQDTR